MRAIGELVDAAELARRLGVSRDYVYEHQAELGAIRLGSGPRARLRFDVDRALELLTGCTGGRTSAAPAAPAVASLQGSSRRRRSRSGTSVDLLPIRGSGDAA